MKLFHSAHRDGSASRKERVEEKQDVEDKVRKDWLRFIVLVIVVHVVFIVDVAVGVAVVGIAVVAVDIVTTSLQL